MRKCKYLCTPALLGMCRGMAILGECERPLFRQVFDATVSSHEKRPLEPRLLRQVYQVCTQLHLPCFACTEIYMKMSCCKITDIALTL